MTNGRAWPEPPVSRGRAAAAAAFAVLIVCASVVLALGITEPRFRPLLALPAAAAGLVFVFRFPFAAVVGVLFFIAAIFSSGRFKVPVGPLELRVYEPLLGALLLVALVRPRRQWWGGAAGVALAVLFAAVTASAVLAIDAGRVQFADAYHYSRALAPLLLFFVVVRLFPELRDIRRLLLVAGVLAATTGVVSLAASSPDSSVAQFLNPNDSSAIRDKEGMGMVNRVRLAGTNLAYVIFWYGAVQAMLTRGSRRVLWLTLLTGMGIGLALSFNRNMWLGLAIGFALILLISHRGARRPLVVGLAALVAAGAVAGLVGVRVSNDSRLYPVIERAATLLDPRQEARDSSLTERFLENRFAMAALEQHPLTGVGPGAPFGLATTADLGYGPRVRVYNTFVHNQYLHLLLIAGPVALLSFLIFILAPIISGLRRMRTDPEFLSLAVGVALAMVSAMVMIYFVHPTGAGVIGLVIGAMVVLKDSGREVDAELRDADRPVDRLIAGPDRPTRTR